MNCLPWLGNILVLAIIVAFLAPASRAFDLPDRDPWYFQSDQAGYTFVIPDKAQHYWGSTFLNELGKRLPLPQKEVTSPALSFAAGFFYEVWQESQGVGFSPRDLVADALGVASSQFSSKSLTMWLDYSVSEKTIMINLTRQL